MHIPFQIAPSMYIAHTQCWSMTARYDEGELRYDRGYAYIAMINSFSQMWAIYCLILFYLAFKHGLECRLQT